MSLASSFTSVKAKAYELYGKDPAKMLLHTGAFGWILSSVAQITGLVVNDKISSDQKKFLIPQEIADAAINILTFYTITRFSTKLGEKLVTSGKIITKPVRNYVEKFLTQGKLKVKLGDLKQGLMKDLTETRGNALNSQPKLGDFSTDIEKIVKFDSDVKVKYYGFKTGVKVIASTLGAVVSSNFITPYVRNHIGANIQKRSLKQAQAPQAAVIPAPSRLNMEDYKKQAIMKTTYAPTGSSVKI